MRILFGSAVVAVFLSFAHAQSCIGQMPSVRPAIPCLSPLQSLCLCGTTGRNCHWEWVCPTATRPAAQLDPSIPLQVNPPTLNAPADTMRKIQEIRQMQQQTELLRQQTEALRRNNQIQEEDSLSGTDLGHYPDFPVADAYATMPT